MKAAFAILAGFLFSATIAAAQPASVSTPPVFKIVNGTDKEKGQITLIETVTRTVPVQKEVAKLITTVENGVNVTRAVKEIVTEYVPVVEQRLTQVDAAKARVITPDGKQLPIDEVWKRLKKDTVVAVSGDGGTPAPAFLKALNAETLVIIAPSPRVMVAPAPPKMEKIEAPKKLP